MRYLIRLFYFASRGLSPRGYKQATPNGVGAKGVSLFEYPAASLFQ
jgi:hypothetical protein